MLDRAKKSFAEGVKSVKWFAAFLSERTRVETTRARLLYESRKLENRLEELYCDIGKRVTEIKDKEEKDVLKDFIVLQAISEIKKIREEIDDYRSRANDLNKPEE